MGEVAGKPNTLAVTRRLDALLSKAWPGPRAPQASPDAAADHPAPSGQATARRGIGDLAALQTEIDRILQAADPAAQLTGLSTVYYDLDISSFLALDPFSDAYRQAVLASYAAITCNAGYDPAVMERTESIAAFDTATCPLPYRFKNSVLVGDFLICYGWILTSLDVKAGADILEYGSGEGQLSIQLARMGCNVHAIDIEERFLASIGRQCDAIGIEIVTRRGQFGDGFGAKRFDRIVFFEAFHHCLDHYAALVRMRDLLKPDGFICFAGEPVVPEAGPDREILPYAWGLRLDGDAMRSIMAFGWMELGYAQGYFVELLARCGYAVEFRPCPASWRGSLYIARPYHGAYPIGSNTLIRTHDGRSGWHASEGTHRWTDGDAWFPLPDAGCATVSVTVANYGGTQNEVSLSCLHARTVVRLAAGAETRLDLARPQGGVYLRIQSGSFQPSAGGASADDRVLGIAVKAIAFQP